MSSLDRDDNRVPVAGSVSSVTGNPINDYAIPTGSINAKAMALVDADGVQITSFGGGTQYDVNEALGDTPTGTLSLAIRDDALSALNPAEGDAVGLRVNANGALWTIDPSLSAVIGSNDITMSVGADSLSNTFNSIKVSAFLYGFTGGSWGRVGLGSGGRLNNSPIAGEAGVQGGAGTVTTNTQRVVLATNTTVPNTTGNIANDATDSGNPLKIGFYASTTNRTRVASGDRADGLSDTAGRQVMQLGHVRDLRGKQTTTISNSTTETTVVTAESGVLNDLVALVISNTSADTSTRIDFRDTTGGTVLFSVQAPANSTVGFSLPGFSIPQTTANTNWTAQCATATTDVRILAIFEKNT